MQLPSHVNQSFRSKAVLQKQARLAFVQTRAMLFLAPVGFTFTGVLGSTRHKGARRFERKSSNKTEYKVCFLFTCCFSSDRFIYAPRALARMTGRIATNTCLQQQF